MYSHDIIIVYYHDSVLLFFGVNFFTKGHSSISTFSIKIILVYIHHHQKRNTDMREYYVLVLNSIQLLKNGYKTSLNIELDNFNRNIFINRRLIKAHTHLNIISCGGWQLLQEPWRVV